MESWQKSSPETLLELPWSSWWHPRAAATFGSHHALQNSEALGPAANTSTIDSTVARNTTTLVWVKAREAPHSQESNPR